MSNRSPSPAQANDHGQDPGIAATVHDGYESDERGISQDVAFQLAIARQEVQFRSRVRRYKPVTDVEIAQRRAFRRLISIRQSVLPPQQPLCHFYGSGLTSQHPVRVSYLPFYTDDCIDFDLRFTQPMERDRFDQAMTDIFGESCEHLFQFLAKEEDLPLPNPPIPCYYQAYEQARCFLAILSMPRRAKSPLDSQHARPTLLNSTEMRNSLLPGCWPWPDHLGDAPGRPDLFAHKLTKHWRIMEAYDWVSQDTPWSDVEFTTAAHGETPPHIFCFLAHESVATNEATASMPELHYITFMMRERLRDPGWTLHRYHPIILFNFDGVHVRITQAHFDGVDIILRRTDPIELLFTSDLAPLKMALRWALARPLSTTLRGELNGSSDAQDNSNDCTPGTPTMKTALSA